MSGRLHRIHDDLGKVAGRFPLTLVSLRFS